MPTPTNEPWPLPDDSDIAAFLDHLRVDEGAPLRVLFLDDVDPMQETDPQWERLMALPVLGDDTDACLPDLGEPDDDGLWWGPDDSTITPH